jgi:hypothetical protein
VNTGPEPEEIRPGWAEDFAAVHELLGMEVPRYLR